MCGTLSCMVGLPGGVVVKGGGVYGGGVYGVFVFCTRSLNKPA